MNGKKASLILVGICVIIAILLLVKIIEFIAGAIIFAIALVVLGLVSKNFRK
jgi:hypothetical protein